MISAARRCAACGGGVEDGMVVVEGGEHTLGIDLVGAVEGEADLVLGAQALEPVQLVGDGRPVVTWRKRW